MTETFHALPPESPMDMPVQSLGHAPPPSPRPPSSPKGIALRRILVIGGAILLTAIAANEMHKVLGVNGITPLEITILVVFVSLFAWIALSMTSSLAGFIKLLRPLPRGEGDGEHGHDVQIPPTALLMPAYNEDPARIMAALAVIHADLARLNIAEAFDFFILSDTTNPDAWVTEEAAYLALRAHLPHARIFYRRRPKNTERKAGNIADWVKRWGGAYPQFMILDADSLMTGACIAHLARTMAAMPGTGLIQSLPVIVGAQTLFARAQQFAGRVYGPMIAEGIATWHGSEGNYWGHNAMIRTVAFASAAGLPTLPGRKPFGGHILSHDFVEAALIRRAGWAIHMLPSLQGSFEECPPSLTELGVRDRRWCQGNLQHAAILPARGLHPVSRMHLLMGIGSYVTAPLWLLFLVMGILISLQARFVPPNYFPTGQASLFPLWPAVDPVRSMWVFIGTMGVLLGPKLLAWFAVIVHAPQRRAFGGAVRMLLGVLVESVVSGLLAPVAMLTQSASVISILAGRDGGWQPQQREDGRVPFRETFRKYLPHTLTGLSLGLASWAVSWPLLWWMSPVVIGLAFAAPLAAITAARGPGRTLRRLGLLRTPEEAAPPTVVVEARTLQAQFTPPKMNGIDRLLADPVLLAAHRAMLPPPRRPGDPFDPALLLGMAKLGEMHRLSEVASLTLAERAAILADGTGLEAIEALSRSDGAMSTPFRQALPAAATG